MKFLFILLLTNLRKEMYTDALEEQIVSRKGRGYIEVICGSMFSGKTEELIRRVKRAEFAKLKTSVFKPHLDIRYDSEKIVSHNANTTISTPIKSAKEILSLVNDSTVVAIDEAQFFSCDLVDVCNTLANKGKRIIIAGLDMDFLGKPFGAMPQLLAIAESITKVHAICVDCGEIANFSFRLTKAKSQIQIGEKAEYKPLCRKCFNDNI